MSNVKTTILNIKYRCHNGEYCSATWTWDDCHCNGCRHKGKQKGDI